MSAYNRVLSVESGGLRIGVEVARHQITSMPFVLTHLSSKSRRCVVRSLSTSLFVFHVSFIGATLTSSFKKNGFSLFFFQPPKFQTTPPPPLFLLTQAQTALDNGPELMSTLSLSL